MDIFVFLLAIF